MPVDTLDSVFFEKHVARIKAAWREHAQSLSWEEKIAVTERMRKCDMTLKRARDGNTKKA